MKRIRPRPWKIFSIINLRKAPKKEKKKEEEREAEVAIDSNK